MKPKGFSIDLMEALKGYAWPGNVREMINTIDGMLAAGANDSTLYTKHLPLQVRVQIVRGQMQSPSETPADETRKGDAALPSYKAYRETSERKYLDDLIRTTRHNIPKACEISGISRSRLYEMLAKYGLNTSN